MSATQSTAESTATLVVKAAPPVGVTVANIAGLPVSDMVLWATLLYTLLLIIQKGIAIWKDLRS